MNSRGAALAGEAGLEDGLELLEIREKGCHGHMQYTPAKCKSRACLTIL